MTDDEGADYRLQITVLKQEVELLKKQRDRIRREWCLDRCARYSMPDHETWRLEARKLAESKGWKCFDE